MEENSSTNNDVLLPSLWTLRSLIIMNFNFFYSTASANCQHQLAIIIDQYYYMFWCTPPPSTPLQTMWKVELKSMCNKCLYGRNSSSFFLSLFIVQVNQFERNFLFAHKLRNRKWNMEDRKFRSFARPPTTNKTFLIRLWMNGKLKMQYMAEREDMFFLFFLEGKYFCVAFENCRKRIIFWEIRVRAVVNYFRRWINGFHVPFTFCEKKKFQFAKTF